MITSLLNSGFGHSVRFIAMVENLRKNTDKPIACLAPDCMLKFLSTNVSPYKCEVYNLFHYYSLVKKTAKQVKKNISPTDKKILKRLHSTSVFINDFFANNSNLKRMFSEKSISCCLYHGDINTQADDDKKTASFKQMVRQTANQHDIFFHINLQRPPILPDMNCIYIPIPIISRQMTIDKQTVNTMLGLPPKEKFILIHGGSAVMENVYSGLYNFYNAVNHLKTEYRIVVASGLENNKFPFHPGIIKAQLFNNGTDLVNASEMVISKPGMGILQDCISTKKPLLFLPEDFTERKLKVDLLNKLMSGSLPIIKKLNTENLDAAIKECLKITELYDEVYSRLPVNGAQVLAKSVDLLKYTHKNQIRDIIPQLKE
ncbi:MAG: hypothetical protein AB7G87_13360, partial [Clostridia bacterium]